VIFFLAMLAPHWPSLLPHFAWQRRILFSGENLACYERPMRGPCRCILQAARCDIAYEGEKNYPPFANLKPIGIVLAVEFPSNGQYSSNS